MNGVELLVVAGLTLAVMVTAALAVASLLSVQRKITRGIRTEPKPMQHWHDSADKRRIVIERVTHDVIWFTKPGGVRLFYPRRVWSDLVRTGRIRKGDPKC